MVPLERALDHGTIDALYRCIAWSFHALCLGDLGETGPAIGVLECCFTLHVNNRRCGMLCHSPRKQSAMWNYDADDDDDDDDG